MRETLSTFEVREVVSGKVRNSTLSTDIMLMVEEVFSHFQRQEQEFLLSNSGEKIITETLREIHLLVNKAVSTAEQNLKDYGLSACAEKLSEFAEEFANR